MSHTEHEQPILRTPPTRMGKMLAITVGIMVVGAAIFFSMWDYWISTPPAVAQVKPVKTEGPAVATGKEIKTSLKFIESSDFRTLAFNALPGEEGNNPEIQANVGDKIIFDVTNGGKTFHSFGVTDSAEGIGLILSGTAIKDANNPLKPSEGGQSTFIPTREGTYYYICTVPGHREQGMEGKITVSPKQSSTSQAAAPTGNKVSFDLNFIESSDFRTLAFNALPGEEGNNPELKANVGDKIIFDVTNGGKTFHSFGVTDSAEGIGLILSGTAIKDANNPLKPSEGGQST